MQEAPIPPICEVVILTALGLEYKAVSEHLQDMKEITHQGTVYGYGNFTGQHRTWHVAVAEIGMGGPTAATETERAISYFRPQITLFVGVGGGLKDVKLGDVVAASKVYAYESGKVGPQFQPRPEVWRASHALEQRARAEARDDKWLTRLGSPYPDPVPQVHIGALAAGEKVLASTQSDFFHLLKATYGDTLAIEMEGHGFLAAVHANHNVHALVVRGISDLIDDKSASDATGSQKRAAQYAAAFAFQILAKFTFPTPSYPLATPGVWNVPYSRNPHFTGRNELLDRLSRQLTPSEQNDTSKTRRAALTQPQAIKGLGGIGKTQIAAEYAYRSRDLDRYVHTLWINATTEEAIMTSFLEVAELLPSFSAKGEADQQKLVEAVNGWLAQCEQRWLLIFDNADDLSLVRKVLPQQGNGSILLTTRSSAVGSLAESVEVENMGLIEGTTLLFHRAQRLEHASEEEQNEATNIVIALDAFPLALEQAGAYIEETACSLVDYLQIYQTHRKDLLARRGMLATNYPATVATTWALSFQKVEQANPAAAELLRFCSFLAPDKIPEELIRDGVAQWSPLLQQAVADLFTFNQMVEELLKFSLVQRLAENQTLGIHRLVQAVQIDTMEPEVRRRWAARVIQAVNEVFPKKPQDRATWPQCLRYLDQAQACDTLIEQYKLPLITAALLLNRTGFYLEKHALYTVAEPLYQRALAICEQRLGTTHPNTAVNLSNLAVLYTIQGRYREAEPLYQRALAIDEQHFGATHPHTATSLNNLAALYDDQGRYREAELFYRRALAICEQQLGATHPHTAHSLNNLALLYDKERRYDEAESLYQHALAIYKQELGVMHPSTAQGLNNLADLYDRQGRYEEAKPLFQQALTIREQVLGEAHPDTAQSIWRLAVISRRQKHYQEAMSLYRRALSIYKQTLGEAHLRTQSLQRDYISLLRAMGHD